jgi:pumilio RNA-binding family
MSIVKEFEVLAKDPHGSFILSLCVDFPEFLDILAVLIAKSFNELSVHRYGCCLVKKLLRVQKSLLKNLILRSLNELSRDPFGNYIVQEWVEWASVEEIWETIRVFCSIFVENATHKFGSNVMEKLLERIQPAQQIVVMEYLLEDKEIVSILCQDCFGNYVAQKLFGCGTRTQQMQVQIT